MSTSMLKLTESDSFITTEKKEINILYLLKVLQSNLGYLEKTGESRDDKSLNQIETKKDSDLACQEKFSGL